ncbi:hypothetical protein MUP35_03290 [Patescibacteria group bacterium]|nr:hypothetical protein [Patescibacteria group bacterium]
MARKPKEEKQMDQDLQNQINEMLAAARAEAQAIIDAAKAQAATISAKKPRAAKAHIALTVEELEALAEETAAKEVRAAEINEQIAALQDQLAGLKAELKEITGKGRTGGASNRGPVGVGAFVKNLITEGLTNEEILEQVHVNFPANNTNVSCINWYRNALKQWPNGVRPSRKKIAEALEAEEEEEAGIEADDE